MLHEPLPSNYCRDYAWLQKSVGQSNILQYLDNFLPINFPDNDIKLTALSQCLETSGTASYEHFLNFLKYTPEWTSSP